MRRFFTNNKPFLAILSFVAVLFVIPGVTHAGTVLPDWMDTGTKFFESIISSPIEIFLLPAASFIMYIGGNLMDTAINFGLHTAYIFSLSPAINLGWVIVRDICNIFFIFILIYISLGTIVKGTSFGTKDLLTKVIIAALLINFSLFVTKAVIDVSNVFGLWLYGGITKTLTVNSAVGGQTSLSGLIASRLEILQFGASNAKANQNVSAPISTDPSKSFVGRIIRLAIVLIATYIFFYTSVLFLARSITLLFLMVFSPIGFMGGVLPQIKEYADDWKKELTTAAMFPVVYLLMLYISLQFINSLELLKNSFPEAAKNNGDFTIAQYFQYFIIIFMLQACLNIAKKNSGKLGSTMGGLADTIGKFAVNAGVGIASGGTALVARAGIASLSADTGKKGSAFKDTLRAGIPIVNQFGTGKDWKKDLKKSAKDGSWDMRNMKIPGVGKETLGSTLGNIAGVKIDTKTAKEYNEEKKNFQKELKLETDTVAVLEEIKNIEKARIDFAAGTITQAQMDTVINTSKSNIRAKTSKLSNQELEAVTARAHQTSVDLSKKTTSGHSSNFILGGYTDALRQNQTAHIASSEMSKDVKDAIQGARHMDVNTVLVSKGIPGVSYKTGTFDGDLKQAFGKLGASEIVKLPLATLENPDILPLLRPEHLRKIVEEYDYGQRTAIRNWITATYPAGPGANPVRKWLDENTEGQLF